MDGGRSRQVRIDVTNTFDDLLIIWPGWKQFICHQSCQYLAIKWRNCSPLQNYPELAQRRKNHFVTVGGLLASAFPRLQPQLFPVRMDLTPSLKSQARVHWWLQDSRERYQCCNTGKIHLRNSSNHQEAVQGIFACRWWKFSALFEIHVDLELVSIKWIFILC